MLKKNTIFSIFPILLVIHLSLFSCILKSEKYSNKNDIGTYSGTTTHYQSIQNVKAVCPKINISIILNQNNMVDFAINPISINISSGSTSVKLNEKNQFNAKIQQNFSTNFIKLFKSIPVCDPTNWGLSSANSIQIKTANELGHKAEIGGDIARGSLFLEIECNDGRLLPLCLYYFQLQKQ